MNVLGWGIEARPHEWSQNPPAYQMAGNRDVKILSMSTERGDTISPASPPYRYRYGHGILLSWLKVGTDGFISLITYYVGFQYKIFLPERITRSIWQWNIIIRRRAFRLFQNLSIVNSINCMIHNFSSLTRFHRLYFRYSHNRGKFDSS